MKKNVVIAIIIFLIGLSGGFSSHIFWPHIGGSSAEQGPVYLSETKQVYIQENVALTGAIERVEKTVVAVKTQLPTGGFLQGSGLIITSDGLMVTLAELVPSGSSFNFFVEGERLSYQVLKRDLNENLALVKFSKSGLVTAGFARLDKIKLGERVFLLGASFKDDVPSEFANEGVIRELGEDIIQTSITESSLVSGSPLFNIEGEILGINTVDSAGRVNAIPVSKIRDFVGM